MKLFRCLFPFLVAVLFAAPSLQGQDLSNYRNFSFGMSLTDLSKQVEGQSADVNVLHQRPALIQQLMCWPPLPSDSSLQAEPVREVLFSFYNGKLYRIVLSYDTSATEGLTPEDMVQALSARYGAATRPAATVKFQTNENYERPEKVIARWEDSQYSLTLFRSSLARTFGIVMLSKGMNLQAETAAIEAVKLEREGAPQKKVEQVKIAAENLEAARQKNIKAFRP
jgi:hypothetical protein